ncbi:hypothetical protein Celaphus_00016099 [Cervus elaphus hippelaphus]|uniref:Uncharacterized protein n=1 Tax=Cervus elaphus hippelaphus TaxID=46360 RepID=A0A212CEG3_CEREH|nr:hypothetical protein Celaphus_00016099 [Cervus elaphus hippelaphus]
MGSTRMPYLQTQRERGTTLSATAPEHPPQLLPALAAQDSSLHPAGPALRDLTPSSETPHPWPGHPRRDRQPLPIWSQPQPQVPVLPRQKKPAAQRLSSIPPSRSAPAATATAPSPSEIQACPERCHPLRASPCQLGPSSQAGCAHAFSGVVGRAGQS